MKKDFEYELDKKMNEEIEIPKSVLDKKELAFSMIKNNNKKEAGSKKKWAIAAALGLIIVGGFNFREEIVAGAKSILFGKEQGFETAIDKGYVKELENVVMKDQGIEFKVEKYLIDNKSAVFTMKMNFEDPELAKHVNSLDVIVDSISADGGARQGMAQIMNVDKDTKEVTLNAVFDFDEGENLDNFTMKIREIQLFTDLNSPLDWEPKVAQDFKEALINCDKKLFKLMEGNWETTVKVDEKFKNPNVVSYKAVEDNELIKVDYAKLSPTGMKIEYRIVGLTHEQVVEVSNSEPKIKVKLIDEGGRVIEEWCINGTEGGDSDSTLYFRLDSDITSFDASNSYTLVIENLQGTTHNIKLVK